MSLESIGDVVAYIRVSGVCILKVRVLAPKRLKACLESFAKAVDHQRKNHKSVKMSMNELLPGYVPPTLNLVFNMSIPNSFATRGL